MAATAHFQPDYLTGVYAGVLGKIIGVYLGRPFEGWSYRKLTEVFGHDGVRYYVNNHPAYLKQRPAGHPLVVTDDDIAGTFTFFRALEDFGFTPDLSAEQVGRAWLNYIIEQKTVLWWGGMGTSTEHTAYLRLKRGVAAPASGSIATNGLVVAEQIGAQIFIDAWGLASPGNPEQAARLARAAGTVSHDGESVHGAVVVAVMIAEAFVNTDINHLLDTALRHIPATCLIARLIGDIRGWVKEDHDWRKTRERIEERYGYAIYGGGCHIIPNHALIILALLYAPDSFADAQHIVNTAGWDTDCNAANVGCIQGVRLGLDAIDADYPFRGPVADRILLPTAEGGRAITDALAQALHIAHGAHRLAGRTFKPPKNARYSFALPGSVQGFMPIEDGTQGVTASVENAAATQGAGRVLRISVGRLSERHFAGAAVATFFTREDLARTLGYGVHGSPTLYTGQTVSANLTATAGEGLIRARLAGVYYSDADAPGHVAGEWTTLQPNTSATLNWTVPPSDGRPFYELRLELSGTATDACIEVDAIDVTGTPTTALIPEKIDAAGDLWLRAWVNGMFSFCRNWRPMGKPSVFFIQNEGVGAVSIGTEEWRDYRFSCTLRPHMADAFGIAVAYRGKTRHIAFMLRADGTAVLEQHEMGDIHALAQAKVPFELYRSYPLAMEWNNGTVRCFLDGKELFQAPATATGGGVAIRVQEGRVMGEEARVEAV